MEYEGARTPLVLRFLVKGRILLPLRERDWIELLPINSPDASILRGELVLDTWGDGLNRLPYSARSAKASRNSGKKCLRLTWRKIKTFTNKPFSDFCKGYPRNSSNGG